MTVTILIACPKGGTGKTTIGLLVLEWIIYNNWTFDVRDTDDNHDIEKWIAMSEAVPQELNGRGTITPGGSRTDISALRTSSPDYLLIDTPGTRAGAETFQNEADIILAPVTLSPTDLNKSFLWYANLDPNTEKPHTWLIPNRLEPLGPSKDDQHMFSQFREMLFHFGIGDDHLLPGVCNRGVYKNLIGGTNPTNFFSATPDALNLGKGRHQGFLNAQNEARDLMQLVFKEIN